MDMREAVRTYNMSGGYFFTPDTMKFWDSRIESELINNEYFVTSEPDMYGKNRKYTVRHFTGNYTGIETIGEFRQYGSAGMAMAAIKKLIYQGE